MFYHLFIVVIIFFFADGTHVTLKQEAPTQVACAQAVKDEGMNIKNNVAAQAPYESAGKRVNGYLIECLAFNVPAVEGN
jgi:sulfur relay (sulfurtransferase) complex TusBCD TusD component (DsrE family)